MTQFLHPGNAAILPPDLFLLVQTHSLCLTPSSQDVLTWLVGKQPDVTYWCIYTEGGLECARAHLVYTPKGSASITIVTLESSDWLTAGLGYWLHIPSWMSFSLHPHSLVRLHTWYSNTNKPLTNTSHLSASLPLQFTQPLASPLTSYSLLTQALKEQDLSITGPFADISSQTGCLKLLWWRINLVIYFAHLSVKYLKDK